MSLKLYTSLHNKKITFEPVRSNEVSIYVCGVTPYDVTHLGHAFSYVHFDVLRRYLLANKLNVKYVQNLTDIDDDMIMVSKRLNGKPISEIRDENDALLRNDLDQLNVLRPTAYPYATDHIQEIITATSELLQKNIAYVVDGDVFFKAEQFDKYGNLNNATYETLLEKENPEAKQRAKRRGPLDFLLWQKSPDDEPGWDSPWSRGRPGWSIECTVMSTAHLGEQIDIHGGGKDLLFPHHENEIAQAESLSGEAPFCNWWMHNGMLQLDGVKMSKSLGNLVLVRDLLKTTEADHLRLYLLSTHYRSDANYQIGDLDDIKTLYEKLKIACRNIQTLPKHATVTEEFRDAMDDDLNTPLALQKLSASANRIINGNDQTGEAEALQEALNILGFAFAGARGPALNDFSP